MAQSLAHATIDAEASLIWKGAPVAHVAIIETHIGIKPHKKLAVPVPLGQSLDFDEGPVATRRWLHPYLGTQFHLVEFVEVVAETPTE